MRRKAVSPELTEARLRTDTTAVAAVMAHRDKAHAVTCGTLGQYL